MNQRRTSFYVSALALLAAGAGIVLFGLVTFADATDGSKGAPPARLTPSAPPATSTLAVPAHAPRASKHQVAHVRTVADEHEPAREREHPHPLTLQHERLRRERHFVAQLDDAMDARNGALVRETLEHYEREFPEDQQRLQAGYAVIADCLERGPSARASAERFYEENRGSTLRRWVRRLCLETRG